MKYIFWGTTTKVNSTPWLRASETACSTEALNTSIRLRANGHWGGGEALQSPESALTLSWKNGKVVTTDGPYAETKEQIGGILFLEARDMNHAVQLIGQHPALTFGTIFEIRPVGDMSEIMKASEQRRSQKTAR